MTQNTTTNDKPEQCDTKHNALKIYLAGENEVVGCGMWAGCRELS